MRWNFVKRGSSAIQYEIYEVQYSITIVTDDLPQRQREDGTSLINVAKRYMLRQW